MGHHGSPPARPGMPPRPPPRPAQPPKPAGAAPGALPPEPGAQGLGNGAVLGAPEAAGVPSALPAVDAAPPAAQSQWKNAPTSTAASCKNLTRPANLQHYRGYQSMLMSQAWQTLRCRMFRQCSYACSLTTHCDGAESWSDSPYPWHGRHNGGDDR